MGSVKRSATLRGMAITAGLSFAALLAFSACGGGKEKVAVADAKDTGDSIADLDARGGKDGTMPDAARVDVGGELCVPKCGDKECGPDGCGGECGQCPAAAPECKGGYCTVPCSPDCEGKECGPDGCGGECGKCPAAAPYCVDSACSVDCTPDCEGKQCGPDGCGGSCGWCGAQELCSDGLCVCQPDCAAKECGSDECGGSCGLCPPEKPFCDGHFCTDDCQPDCAGKKCGDDGCGGGCGECDNPLEKCQEGQCVCVPICGPKECGDDGCGGDCGTCPADAACVEGKCTGGCLAAEKAGTHLGCEFFAVDLDNVEGGQYQPVAVVVIAPSGNIAPAIVEIVNFAETPPAVLSPETLMVDDMGVAPGKAKYFMLPTQYGIDGTVLTNKTFRVKSTQPVAAYQFNPLNGENVFTNDASLLFPTFAGGTEHIALSWPMRTEGYALRGFVAIVAVEQGKTQVQVTPTSPVLQGVGVQAMLPDPSEPYVFELEQGDVLNLETDGAQSSDLTGTLILSDKKVSVFGGHECANVPLGTNYCDHIEQQLLPVASWGTHYVADAFKPRNASQKDVFRVLAGADNVKVTVNPAVAGPYILQKGQWVEFYSGMSFEVVATGPVLLGHYLQGSNYAGFSPHPQCSFGTGIGDPAMTVVLPVSSYQTAYTVLTPESYIEDYINIVAPLGAGKDVFLDGEALSGPFVPVGMNPFEVAIVPVKPGVHVLTSAVPIGLTVYGYDCDVSYAYPGGGKLVP